MKIGQQPANDYCLWCASLADTPDQMEAEAEYEYLFAEECIAWQDAMEARGGPLPLPYYDDEIPF